MIAGIHDDCLHFNGYKPCRPHKETGVHCDDCTSYRKPGPRILVLKVGLAALADALGDPGKRARFGAAARSRVRAMFTIEEHTRRTEAIYRRLTDGADGRRTSR